MRYTFYQEILGIKVEEFNPNPVRGTEEKDVNDCTIRAYCKLLDKSWLDVFNDIFILCRKTGYMYNSSEIAKQYLAEYGYEEIHPAMDENIMTVGEFMYKNKTGKYIIITKSHCACYIDGVWYDKKRTITNPDTFLLERVSKVYKQKGE